MIASILHGFLLAIGLILPLGAQNVFIFSQGAAHARFARALPAVLTAALCDTLLISAAVLGVSVLILSAAWLQTGLFAVGILFLLYMGWSVWRSKPAGRDGEAVEVSARKQAAFAASVSLLNPHAILDTVGVIGTSSLSYAGAEKWAFAFTCIAVSWLWFIGLALAGRLLGSLDKTGGLMKVVNKASALMIWGVALYLMYRLAAAV
ncbi:amino acid transporter [Paenibacillus sp. J31TS4]|uniref:LysE/ArgO family amino acid transporter n=1 Tax=Paenibacillus sp. J31TS4 TaxID=2807195 RepID=UPI001B2AEF4B|nr:LysE/ArgO family amino acid transporter [Paenibacillus sp. J31TS4]GIP38793.1 amino acid transporter [Paenibacillus sp. J31TS4]